MATEYRLVRNITHEIAFEDSAEGGVSMEYVFDPEVRGQVYGTERGPARYTASSGSDDGSQGARLPLNPPDLDEYNNMLYAEKTTVMLKFTEASIEGQNGVVVRGDSAESGRIFVPSPQSMVPLHSLLDMKEEYAGRLSSAVSVVQMSCDNYYHWTMECLVSSLDASRRRH